MRHEFMKSELATPHFYNRIKMNDKLFEQVYNSVNRIYYHGTIHDDINKKNSKYICFFITLDPLYALSYAKKYDGSGFGKLFKIKVIKKLNIFNPKSKKDLERLEDIVSTVGGKRVEYNNFIQKIKETDWDEIFDGDEIRDEIIDIIKLAGYDGWFNYELSKNMQKNGFNKYDLLKRPVIGLFDISNCSIEEVDFYSQEWFIEKRKEDLEEVKDRLYIRHKNNKSDKDIKSEFEQELTSTICPKYLTLTNSDIDKVINDYDENMNGSLLLEKAKKNNGDTGIIYHGTKLKYW